MSRHTQITDRILSISYDFRIISWQRARRSGSRYFNSEELTAFKKAVGVGARAAAGSHHPFSGPCSVEIYATFTPPKRTAKKRLPEMYGKPYTSRSDADNQIKSVCDALQGIIYEDDRQVAHVAIQRAYGTKDAFGVTIMELPL